LGAHEVPQRMAQPIVPTEAERLRMRADLIRIEAQHLNLRFEDLMTQIVELVRRVLLIASS
jgi:hypothetical protein